MNLPNKITVFRIICIPFFVVALLVNFKFHEPIALFLFAIAAISDKVDGSIARSRNLVTDFGKFMDPLADKLLVCSAFICLIELGMMPSWVVIIIIAREFAITGLRTLAASDGIVIAASKWGKAKTVSQMICIIALLILNWFVTFNSVTMNTICVYLAIFGDIMTYVAMALTLYSGIDYFRLNKHVIKSF